MTTEKNQSNFVVAVIAAVLLAIVGLGVYMAMQQSEETDTAKPAAISDKTTDGGEKQQEGVAGAIASPTEGDGEAAAAATTITLTDDGYDKDNYEARVGDVIAVKNESSLETQFSSDIHPTHKETPELNLSIQQPGETVTFEVTKAGTYGFHDHLNARFTGVLVVK